VCGAFTISVGVAQGRTDSEIMPQALIAIADRRLYDAKTHGRNRVVSDDSVHASEDAGESQAPTA
jgi:PleD family two-component response regulator